MDLSRPEHEKYSDSYLLFPDIDVEPYNGDSVVASHDLVGHLYTFVERRPLVKLRHGHYWLHGTYGVPQNTIAAPADSSIPADEEIHVLLAEDHAATQFMLAGQMDHP